MNKLLRYTDIERINEDSRLDRGVERLDEGLFDKFKNFLSKKLGGDVSKADRILSMYSQAKESNLNEIGKIRNSVIAANTKAAGDQKLASQAKELALRAEESIARIKKATEQKLESVEKQFQLLLKGKSDRLKTYIEAKKAEIDWMAAQKEVVAAKKYASEDEVERLESEAESTGKIAKNYQDKMSKGDVNDKEQDKEDIDIAKEREKLKSSREKIKTMQNEVK
jgi:chromosome segregation ATPase